MNEILNFFLSLIAGFLLGAVFLRWALVDGSEGTFIQKACVLVPRQPVDTDQHCHSWILLCLGWPLGEIANMPVWVFVMRYIVVRLTRLPEEYPNQLTMEASNAT